MSALENAKNMSSEEVISKIASSELKEYGVYNEAFAEKINEIMVSRKENQVTDELAVVAALNNADTKGVLLSVLKENANRVFEGMNIAAYTLGAAKKVLQLPAYAADLEKEVSDAAKEAGVEVVTGIVNVRANKYNLVSHIITMVELSDIFEDSYAPGVYVSVNGGECKKYDETKTVAEVLEAAGADVSDVKVYETGYVFSAEAISDRPVKEAKITNGVLNVMTSKNCIIQEVEARITASRKQSCGKCVFCREGLIQLHGMVNYIKEGKGKQEQIEIIKEIGTAMTFSTPCSMGQECAKTAISSVELLPKEFEEHIKKKTCSAGVCFSKTIIYIDPQTCEGCEECADVCPENCIEGKKGFIHMIDEFDCTRCGKCLEACEYDAVIQTNGKLPKLPDRLTKCGRFKKH
jgi:fumarate reductase flavoprotein subunit/NADH-quinone oxidoreductase subunit F